MRSAAVKPKRSPRPSRVFRHGEALPTLLAERQQRLTAQESRVALPVFTPRQQVALEYPLYPEDGPTMGDGNLVSHSVDPRHRVVELVSEPHKTENNTYDGWNRGRVTERKRYQLWSILTVDMESGPIGPRPIWHASVGWYANVGEEAWTVDRWAGKKRGTWMRDIALSKLAELIPELATREGGWQRGIPPDRLSLHVRAPLSPEERAMFSALAKPRFYAATPGVRRALALEQGILPNRTLGE